MRKVKLLASDSPAQLEKEVNLFLENGPLPKDVVDIQYSSAASGDGTRDSIMTVVFSVLIIYNEIKTT